VVSASNGEWVDVSGWFVIGFLSGLRLNGDLNLKVEEIKDCLNPEHFWRGLIS
jgi:hypothetical protein